MRGSVLEAYKQVLWRTGGGGRDCRTLKCSLLVRATTLNQTDRIIRSEPDEIPNVYIKIDIRFG